MTVPTASGKNRHVTSRLDRWSNFCGDAMAMVFFSNRCDTDVFWTHVTIATDVIIWPQPSLMMFFVGFNTVFATQTDSRLNVVNLEQRPLSTKKAQNCAPPDS